MNFISSKKGALTRSATILFVVNVTGTGLSFVTQFVLARLMGPSEFGIYAYVITWISVLMMIGIWGMDSSALRFIAAYRGKDELGNLWGFLQYSRAKVFSLSLLVAALIAFSSWLLNVQLGYYKMLVFWIGSILFLFNVIIQYWGSVLQALKRVVHSQMIQSIFRACGMLILLVIVHYLTEQRMNAITCIILNALSALFTLLLLRQLMLRELPQKVPFSGSNSLRREWRQTSLSFCLISGSQAIISQVDILFVGIFVGTTEVGIYAAASRIAMLITFGITSMNSILAPTIAQLYAQNRREELQKTVTLAARGVLLYTVPAVISLLIAGKWVLGLFGHEFISGYTVLTVLALGQLVIAVCGSVGFLLTMTGHHREALWIITGSAALTAILNLILIPLFGTIGAAIGTMIATSIRSIFLSLVVRKKLNIDATAFSLRFVPSRR